ncbi:MAG: hypothetical protein ACO3GP_08170 [Candidatus Limnocylindrus sp.]
MQSKATDDQILEALQEANGIRAKVAIKFGLNERSLLMRLKKMKEKGYTIPDSTYQPGHQIVDKGDYEFTPLPDDDVPIEELIAQRKRKFQHKREHEEASKLIPIKIKMAGAIGILHFGDPHVDDDGCDIEAIERHTDLVNRTEGLFAANVGDTTNNWVGRLAKLYGEQATSAAQAWKIAEWFVNRCDWLYMIGGNHDLWSGSGDPLRWIAKHQNSLYKSSEARIALRFPTGLEVRVNARHDHSGSSIWNPAHGPMKAALMGTRDHLYVAGHKHESAYSVLKDAISGITMHAMKVASYKIYDRYAKERGFRDNCLSPCALTTINPALPPDHPDLVKVWWEPEEGADYLTFLRRR